MKEYSVAVVGASGLVGGTILKVLEERNFPLKNLYCFASERSAGKTLTYAGKTYTIEALTPSAFERQTDYALFSAGSSISEQYVPLAAASGAVAVDNSKVFRMDPSVPLVVPEVNPEDLSWQKGIVANPNCSTIQCMVALKPLIDAYGAKRIVYSSYQSVSGSGSKGLRDLDEGLNEFYPRPIHGNVLPHIDVFLENGYTKEEEKMINETRKIFHLPNLAVTATTVRVPVRYGHSVSINLETEKDFDLQDVRTRLQQAPGVILMDDPQQGVYPIPEDCEGRDEVFVGRVRRDESVAHGLNLWVVADNIRKGAATNAVQISEALAGLK